MKTLCLMMAAMLVCATSFAGPNERTSVRGKKPAIHAGGFYGDNFDTRLQLRINYPGRYYDLDVDEFEMRIRVADFREWDDGLNCEYSIDEEEQRGLLVDCNVSEIAYKLVPGFCYKIRVLVTGQQLNNLTNFMSVCFFR